VDARERRRMAVAHTALRLLRRKDFRTVVTGTNTHGEHVIIPALQDDPMGYFFDQLREAGGPVYAALLVGEGVAIVGMEPEPPPGHAPTTDDEDCPIHRNTEIGMVLEYLRAHGRVITCYEVAPNVLVQLVEDARPNLTSP
jgi:hypothetical protein